MAGAAMHVAGAPRSEVSCVEGAVAASAIVGSAGREAADERPREGAWAPQRGSRRGSLDDTARDAEDSADAVGEGDRSDLAASRRKPAIGQDLIQAVQLALQTPWGVSQQAEEAKTCRLGDLAPNDDFAAEVASFFVVKGSSAKTDIREDGKQHSGQSTPSRFDDAPVMASHQEGAHTSGRSTPSRLDDTPVATSADTTPVSGHSTPLHLDEAATRQRQAKGRMNSDADPDRGAQKEDEKAVAPMDGMDAHFALVASWLGSRTDDEPAPEPCGDDDSPRHE